MVKAVRQMSDDWLTAHLEAERQVHADEAARAELAALNARLATGHLNFAREEAAREAKAMQVCPNHGLPTTIPGMCQACIAEAEMAAAAVADPGPTVDMWVLTNDDIPDVGARQHSTAQEAELAPSAHAEQEHRRG